MFGCTLQGIAQQLCIIHPSMLLLGRGDLLPSKSKVQVRIVHKNMRHSFMQIIPSRNFGDATMGKGVIVVQILYGILLS